jgi:hypothetical protein
MKIQQRAQKMVQAKIQQMAQHIAAAAVVAQQEMM